jgi:hypothetical protein
MCLKEATQASRLESCRFQDHSLALRLRAQSLGLCLVGAIRTSGSQDADQVAVELSIRETLPPKAMIGCLGLHHGIQAKAFGSYKDV